MHTLVQQALDWARGAESDPRTLIDSAVNDVRALEGRIMAAVRRVRAPGRHERDFPRTRESVREVRAWVVEIFEAAGVDDTSACSQAVSEAANNAVLHAQGEHYTVCVLPSLRIEVRDKSRELPVRKYASDESEEGRGLALLEKAAKNIKWAAYDDGSGKCVAFTPVRTAAW